MQLGTNVVAIQAEDSGGCRWLLVDGAVFTSPAMPTAVGDWRFDGGADDSSGWGNHGAVNGATLTTDRFGNLDSAYAFDGVNDVVTVSDSPSLSSPEATQALTISAWVRVDGWYQDWNIFAILNKYRSRGDDGWEFILGAVPSTSIAFAPALYVSAVQSDWTTLDFGEWHQVVAVYDAGDARLYVDGALFAEDWSSQALVDTEGGSVHIGFSQTGPDEYSDGAIDEVLLYDVALTKGQVAALYHP